MGLCHSTTERTTRNEAGTTSTCTAAAEGEPTERLGSGRWKRQRDLKSGEDRDGIHQVVGRMVTNGASEIACLYTQQGKKGTNQDAMLVWENFSSRSDTIFCGVFDGHGPFGHMVAKKVRDTLPFILSSHWKSTSESEQKAPDNGPQCTCTDGGQRNESLSMDDQWCESQPGEDNEKLPEMYLPLKHAMLKACQQMDKELKLHPAIDCFCSGTTAVTLIKQGRDLVVGNVGDSRAVLATRDVDNSLIAIYSLTIDLKPDLPREAARIQKCKGRVFALQDEPEIARVWLPDCNSPGLAMARAFGDVCLKSYGLISVPDMYYHHLTEKDQFIILASDGVWDVLSNKETVDVVASAPSKATAARALVDTAVRAWRLKYPTSKNDDCAVVCLFVGHSSSVVEDCDTRQETHEDVKERVALNANVKEEEATETSDNSLTPSLEHVRAANSVDEIVPVCESKDEKTPENCRVESKMTLAECISISDDDEWSALEGLTRVNSLVSIPRFLSGELRSMSWRKWL